jgi:hypothetical protein
LSESESPGKKKPNYAPQARRQGCWWVEGYKDGPSYKTDFLTKG